MRYVKAMQLTHFHAIMTDLKSDS